jgi:hypothetical protein
VHPVIKKYLRQLIATGLYGNSEPEAAMKLITTGIESRLDGKILKLVDRDELKSK